MNERIKELWDEAWDDDTPLSIIRNKFAELIVRECVAIVDGMTDPEDSERYFWAIQNASQKIKKHFGLKE